MTELLILTAIGGGALLLWHYVNSRQTPQPVYLGAPAWPTMPPIPVPSISLPNGLQQAPTYYGVSSTLLEPFLK